LLTNIRHSIDSQVQRLPGYFKQRDNLMYPAWAYVFPTTILRLPCKCALQLIAIDPYRQSPCLFSTALSYYGGRYITQLRNSPVQCLADSLVAAILWSCITYYPVGLAPEASRFFTFVLILFVVHSMVGHQCRARVLGMPDSL
jgi:hypothetical protein